MVEDELPGEVLRARAICRKVADRVCPVVAGPASAGGLVQPEVELEVRSESRPMWLPCTLSHRNFTTQIPIMKALLRLFLLEKVTHLLHALGVDLFEITHTPTL